MTPIPIVDRRGWRRVPASSVARRLAFPAAKLWSLGARAFHELANRGLLRAEAAEIPIVSVGSLTFGGSGKTPIARWIAGRLADRGRAPAILLRGYESAGGSHPRLVSGNEANAARDGDEAVLLASSLPQVRVIVGPDRAADARLAASLGADVAILDDGHQHRRLARAMNLVIWDEGAQRARRGSGFFREPLSGLARADALLLVDRGEGAPERPPEAPESAPSFRMRLVPRVPPGARAGRAVYALSGIAGPEGFERSLVRAGLRVVGATRHADHHAFTAEELADAERRARTLGADAMATTAKDRVRTPVLFERASLETLVFDLDAETPDEEALLQAIVGALDRRSV